MSDEDTEARAAAMKFADAKTPMALEAEPVVVHKDVFPENGEITSETEIADSPLGPEAPATPRKRRRTAAEVAADKLAREFNREEARQQRERAKTEQAAARVLEREAKRLERERIRADTKVAKAAERIQLKQQARIDKIADAEGGRVSLPAVVYRTVTGHQPRAVPSSATDCWAVISQYLKHLFVDCETSGYPIGHRLYELRTVQLGGEEMAVVLDAADPEQMQVVGLALAMCEKLTAHSAAADAIPLVVAGEITWNDIWAKMHDSVLYLKLTDPKLSGSDASKLKEAAGQILGKYAVSPDAEKAKNELFKAMGCLIDTDITTPPERNGWHQVSKNAKVMAVYAGSDVLDLAAVMRELPPLPVEASVLERERWFEAKCARVGLDGFPLDLTHIQEKIAEHEKGFAETQNTVRVLSDGKITNPKSPEVIKVMKELYPHIDFTIKDKVTREYKDSAGKVVLKRVKEGAGDDPLLYHLSDQILAHRHHATTLGLLLRPLEGLCLHGDSRMRPTVYTINADTGRCSCVRPNGQQFSRRGGIRACVHADPGWVMCNADFQGCEIRVGAGLSGDKAMLAAETEPFCHKCQQMTAWGSECPCGVKDGELAGHTGLHWLAAHETFGKDATKEDRYQSKAVIFRKMFGGGPDSEIAYKIANVFDTRVAPVYAAWDKQLRKAFKSGTMVYRDYATGENVFESLEGEQRGIYRTYSGRNIYIKAPHAFSNFAIQGTARELLLDGVIRWSQTPWGDLPLLPIHDELLLWVREAEFEQATAALKQCMETDVLSSPGFPVHIGADPELKQYTYWPDSSLWNRSHDMQVVTSMSVNSKKTETTEKPARRQTMLLDFETYCNLTDIKTDMSRSEGHILTLGETIKRLIDAYRESGNQAA